MKPLDMDTFHGRVLMVLAFLLMACGYIALMVYDVVVLLAMLTIGPLLWLVLGRNPILAHHERLQRVIPR